MPQNFCLTERTETMRDVTDEHRVALDGFEDAYTATRDLCRDLRRLAKGSSFAMRCIDDGAIKAATEAQHAVHVSLFTYLASALHDDEYVTIAGTDGEWTAERAARQARDARALWTNAPGKAQNCPHSAERRGGE